MIPSLLLSFAFAAASADIPEPASTKPTEPMAKAFSAEKAAEYLDGVGVNWTRDR
jgi:squalene-hopene/tetraprenyl-beta-curcumene cyclase